MNKEKGSGFQQQAKPESFDPIINRTQVGKPQEQQVHSTNSQDVCKQQQEDASSAKSDVFDSDSPRYTDGIHSSLFLQEPADSSNVLDSDFSQDDDDSLNRGLIHSPCIFPKLEEEEEEEKKYHCLQMPPYSCSLGFSIEDQTAPSWFWSY